MERKRALQILNLDEGAGEDEIKQAYRIGALKWHPDKNSEAGSIDKFREIKEAYDCLSENSPSSTTTSIPEYAYILRQFLSGFHYGEEIQDIFVEIIGKILHLCELKTMILFEKMDIRLLCKINEIVGAYHEILHLNPEFVKKIGELVKLRTHGAKRIKLNPQLDDLLSAKLYVLSESEQTYIVPLWHHELVYELADNAGDFFVEVEPVLPKNVLIDERNHIHIYLVYSFYDLIALEKIEFMLGNKPMSFMRSQLRMMDEQVKILHRQGIPMITNEYVDDIRSDVYVHIKVL